MIIKNSHRDKEAGNKAVGLFEARIASLPAFSEGFRTFLRFVSGYTRCPIFNGRDRFCLIVLFVAAIGFDADLIPSRRVRGDVLDACEKFAYFAHLLRGEALSPTRRVELYREARNVLCVLVSHEFKRRQKSQMALPKFRMLMYVVNAVVHDLRAAPACSDSGVFESALRMFVSRVASGASGQVDLLRGIADHDESRMALDLLRSKDADSPVARSIAKSCESLRPVRSKLMQRSRAVLEKPLVRPLADSDIVRAISDGWARVPGNASGAPGSNVDWACARFFEECNLYRPDHRFAAPVRMRQTVLIDNDYLPAVATAPTCAGAAAVATAAVATAAAATAAAANAASANAASANPNDLPETARLARVVTWFYLPPPAEGLPSDGLVLRRIPEPHRASAATNASATGTSARVGHHDVQLERIFALLHPFVEQTQEGRRRLKLMSVPDTYLRHHAIREPRVAALGQSPYVVLPVTAICRAVRVLPPKWPGPGATRDDIIAAAKCETGPVLVFWEPRDLWLPSAVVPDEWADDGGHGEDT